MPSATTRSRSRPARSWSSTNASHSCSSEPIGRSTLHRERFGSVVRLHLHPEGAGHRLLELLVGDLAERGMVDVVQVDADDRAVG